MPNEISLARNQSGLSQAAFAQALHISTRTLQEWEQGRRQPSGSAKALIRIALNHPGIIRESYKALQSSKESMSRLLDQMAAYLLSGDEIAFSDLILDWYREQYECHLAPKPTDKDEVKLALKASIVERLVEVLNAPPHSQSQSVPKWLGSIAPLAKPLKLQSDRLLEDEEFCDAFKKRNLLAVKNFMFFI